VAAVRVVEHRAADHLILDRELLAEDRLRERIGIELCEQALPVCDRGFEILDEKRDVRDAREQEILLLRAQRS
jgi:hypothetical protein